MCSEKKCCLSEAKWKINYDLLRNQVLQKTLSGNVSFYGMHSFLCFHGLENFDIFYICHNNIHGNDFLDSTVQNLQFACYTEYVVVVLFLLPHKFGRDLNVVERIFVWYKTYCEWTMPHILLLSLLCVYIHMY